MYGRHCKLPESDIRVNSWVTHALPQCKLTPDTQHQHLSLQRLPSQTAETPTATHPKNAASVLVATMVWDKLTLRPAAPGSYARGTTELQVALKQDLLFSSLLQPKCHATVSESMMQQHREYVTQRKRCVARCTRCEWRTVLCW